MDDDSLQGHALAAPAPEGEELAPAPAGPPAGDPPPRLPDSCKVLLKELAEEMLVMHSKQEMAEQRAERAEQQFSRRAQVLQARAEALQRQLEEAQQQVQQERRLRQEAEQRAAQLERQLTAAQQQGRRQRQEVQPQQAQQAQQPDEDTRRLGRAMLAGGQVGPAAQQRQQQQQRAQALDRLLPPEQPAAAPAEQADAAAAGGQSRIVVTPHSSDDDETFRTAVPGPASAAGAAAAAAAAGQAQPMDVSGGEEEEQAAAPAQPQQMRPAAQPLGTLREPVKPGKQAALRKRPAEGSPSAAQAAQRAEGPPPAKQQRREASAAGDRRKDAAGGSQQRPDSASPGDSVLDAFGALGRGRRRSGSTAAAAAAGGSGALSPNSREAGPDLLLRLADAGQGAREGEEEEESGEGPRGRTGRRSVGAIAGVITLKPGETAQQWLNRSIVAYVGTLARERDFRPFEKPVPRSTPDYYRLVKKPMDMATIKIKAQQGQYTTPKEFKTDMLLIVNNAKFYNESHKHPVHQAADRLHDYLRKPHSFFTKVDAEFKQAETAAVLNEERAAQEAELEQEEERLAHSVVAGMNIAVYSKDDINRNFYYLMQARGPVRRLRGEDTDDFGITFEKGDEVIEGHYYDYWTGPDGSWDRSGGRRPYYLQDDKRGLVPASSLLLVDFNLQKRSEPKLSPWDGSEHTIYDVSADLHQQLKRAIKKFTAEPTA